MEKFQRVGVVALILRDDGKFLITKRSSNNDYLPGLYDMPGGEVELGEDPNYALKREISEETSLEVEILKPIYVYSQLQNNIRHQIWIIYECKYKGGEIKLNPDEHEEYRWVTKDELKSTKNIIFLEGLAKDCLA